MTPILDFTQTTTYELTPPSSRLPPALWTVFTALNKVHGIWRWYRKAELYSNPNYLSQLMTGHLVNFVVGDMLMLRIAAQCLLISTRILQCVQQQKNLYSSCQKWLETVKGDYPQPYKRRWVAYQNTPWISPSSAGWLEANGLYLFERLKKITECTAAVFFHCFKLSMNIMDVIDVFNMNPATRNEGINEFFINGASCLDTLAKNKKELLHGIDENRVIIEKILYKSPISYNQLVASVTKTLEKTEILANKAKQITEFGNGIALEAGKRALIGGRVVIGI
jgi:hypothetical protein